MLGEIPDRTLEQAAIRYVQENPNKRSLKTDRSRFRVLFGTDPKLINTKLREINNKSLETFIALRQSDGVKNSTINRALALVSAILNQAANKWEPRWLKEAPAIQFLENDSQPVRRPITWSEQRKLLSVLPPHLSCMAELICHTGMRDAEICNLEWSWIVDYPVINESVIILPAAITKANRERLIPLNRVAKTVIEQRRKTDDANETHVFHYRGKPISRMYNSAWMRARVLSEANLDTLRVHDLRHTAAQRLLDAGVEGSVRDALLGHSDQSMRLRYAPPPIQDLLEAVEKIAVEPPEGSIVRVPTVEEVIEQQRARKSA